MNPHLRLNKILVMFCAFLTTFASSYIYAKHYSITVPEAPGTDGEIRAVQVRNWAPPHPFSKVGDTADAAFVINSVNLKGEGEYTKIEPLGSFEWREDDGSYQSTNVLCNPIQGPFPWWCVSPLLLDLERDGFQVSPEGQGVFFDIRGDGSQPHIQWVAEGTDDGFLAIDLNHNGIVDSGAELFGEGTIIIETGERASNGFEALSQYDQEALGGNGDSKITKKDSVWSSLRLWVDSDGNGVSDVSEMRHLSDFEIVRMKTEPKETKEKHRLDASGNIIPYYTWVKTKSTTLPAKLKMIDIFFKVIE